ncbi:ParB/RepB/Spo0J family partition protein [Mycolicibacterium lutetiense]
MAAPTSVPVEDLSPNPRNPRDEVGDLEDLAGIVDIQLQPAAVVSRAAYARLYPDDVITTPWIVIMGHRRLAAAVKYGRPNLEVVVKDELARDRATLLATAVSENIDRLGFDVIEEAKAVEALVKECGSAREAAKRLGKTDGWVSQRRALLALAPELQELTRRGEIAVRNARTLAKVPTEKQVQSWNAHQEREAQKRNSGERAKSNGKPTAPPQFRTVTVALRNFDEKPADLADALIDTLGDEGVTKLLNVIKRRRRA